MTYPEADRWGEFYDVERDIEAEHVAAVELARRERLDERGLPHVGAGLRKRSGTPQSGAAQARPRKPARFSQCEKILRVLEDGEWHSTAEVLQQVPSIVHSRIAELRKRGYIIEHERVGPGASGSRYRLLREAA
jgi:hypothetical protein